MDDITQQQANDIVNELKNSVIDILKAHKNICYQLTWYQGFKLFAAPALLYIKSVPFLNEMPAERLKEELELVFQNLIDDYIDSVKKGKEN